MYFGTLVVITETGFTGVMDILGRFVSRFAFSFSFCACFAIRLCRVASLKKIVKKIKLKSYNHYQVCLLVTISCFSLLFTKICISILMCCTR